MTNYIHRMFNYLFGLSLIRDMIYDIHMIDNEKVFFFSVVLDRYIFLLLI